ncbi:MAG: glycosyltransferase involved in cell wall biosynthesis [Flavobacteriales bacterium]|jgi:glycosyltransferase involved in cell wall biosynthesis
MFSEFHSIYEYKLFAIIVTCIDWCIGCISCDYVNVLILSHDKPNNNGCEYQMKINFVLPELSLSGGIRVIAIYANMLAARGHKVFIVSLPGKFEGFSGKIRYVKHCIRTLELAPHLLVEAPKADFFDENLVTHVPLSSYRDVIDSDLPDADVSIATWWKTVEPVVQLNESKGKEVYFAQDYGAPNQPLEKLIPTWRMPLHIITISPWLRRLIHDCVDKEADLAMNGVDLLKFQFLSRDKNPEPTVGFVYRSAPQKGSLLIIEALKIVKESVPDLKIVGFGPYPPKEDIELIQEGYFSWNVDDNEINGLYQSCDVWLFATKREGFGLPILEAMASGTPVIATPAGASPDILNMGGGCLVDNSASSMAESIIKLLNLPSHEWQSLSKEARHIAEQFTWESACDQFEAGLNRALEK